MSKSLAHLFLIALVGIALIVWRFMVGLGPATGLSDGYPWGIWIAFDVVTGTALGCGGYAVAILVYILLWRTTLGYRIRAVGQNPDASRYGGIRVRPQERQGCRARLNKVCRAVTVGLRRGAVPKTVNRCTNLCFAGRQAFAVIPAPGEVGR
mgnify:CR=1 FL=1